MIFPDTALRQTGSMNPFQRKWLEDPRNQPRDSSACLATTRCLGMLCLLLMLGCSQREVTYGGIIIEDAFVRQAVETLFLVEYSAAASVRVIKEGLAMGTISGEVGLQAHQARLKFEEGLLAAQSALIAYQTRQQTQPQAEAAIEAMRGLLADILLLIGDQKK